MVWTAFDWLLFWFCFCLWMGCRSYSFPTCWQLRMYSHSNTYIYTCRSWSGVCQHVCLRACYRLPVFHCYLLLWVKSEFVWFQLSLLCHSLCFQQGALKQNKPPKPTPKPPSLRKFTQGIWVNHSNSWNYSVTCIIFIYQIRHRIVTLLLGDFGF